MRDHRWFSTATSLIFPSWNYHLILSGQRKNERLLPDARRWVDVKSNTIKTYRCQRPKNTGQKGWTEHRYLFLLIFGHLLARIFRFQTCRSPSMPCLEKLGFLYLWGFLALCWCHEHFRCLGQKMRHIPQYSDQEIFKDTSQVFILAYFWTSTHPGVFLFQIGDLHRCLVSKN